MRHSTGTTSRIPSGPLAAAGLAVLAATLAASPGPARAAECVPPGAEDADGDGFDDALVSLRATVIDSELDCTTRVGAGSLVVGARLLEAEESDDLEAATVGRRAFVGQGASLLGASIGNGTIVLQGATLSAGIDTDVTIGDRSLIGPDARVLGGDSSAEIGNRAVLGAGALVRGGLYGPRLTVGPGASLFDVEVGAGLIVGSGATLGSRTSGDDGVLVGPNADVGAFSVLGNRAVIGPDATLGSSVDVGPRGVVGARAVIGSGATLGADVRVGDDATVGEFADVPAGTVIPAGGSFPGPG